MLIPQEFVSEVK